MPSYAIGDIQGCFTEFEALLKTVAFEPARDHLYLVGDLVNRGPDSLAVMRWIYSHRDSVSVVLGNHDLHLIAIYAGVAKQKRKDTLTALLAAPDVDILIGWLRKQPLVLRAGKFVFVHAGLPACWTATAAVERSAEVESVLQGDQYEAFLRQMYGNEPRQWLDGLEGWDRLRFVVNACTRARLVSRDGSLDLEFKGELDDAPDELCAWFDAPSRQSQGETIVCGHWSALGLRIRSDLLALDTGCVWGGELTAVRLDDGTVFQVPSLQTPTTEWV